MLIQFRLITLLLSVEETLASFSSVVAVSLEGHALCLENKTCQLTAVSMANVNIDNDSVCHDKVMAAVVCLQATLIGFTITE
jgi:hypothetical protein